MLKLFNKKLRLLYKRLIHPTRRRSTRPKLVIKKFTKSNSTRTTHHHNISSEPKDSISSAVIHPSNDGLMKPIRIASFNAASFSMAPAVPITLEHDSIINNSSEPISTNDRRPKSILKQSPLHPSVHGHDHNPSLTKQQKFAKSRLRVSINLPDNEISLNRSASSLNSRVSGKGKGPVRSNSVSYSSTESCRGRSVVEVLREMNADVLALQDVKAEEENDMKPLSDLAKALGMNYVFAESWAPEYGNAILTKWPIKRWKAQKIFDDTDFRNVLKATIDVPQAGEINFFCTLLDHLDESWRMKQINAIIQSTGVPHILAGGLNSLDETDYSQERWSDIVKYYEEIGKPTPKLEVMKYLKDKQYTDAKDFAGECESVVMIAKGQSVQGTCKYGTRVDYLLSSSNAPYKFIPGSYSVLSSKGTSDHHIVKVDMMKVVGNGPQEHVNKKKTKEKNRTRTVNMIHSPSSPPKGIWKIHS